MILSQSPDLVILHDTHYFATPMKMMVTRQYFGLVTTYADVVLMLKQIIIKKE